MFNKDSFPDESIVLQREPPLGRCFPGRSGEAMIGMRGMRRAERNSTQKTCYAIRAYCDVTCHTAVLAEQCFLPNNHLLCFSSHDEKHTTLFVSESSLTAFTQQACYQPRVTDSSRDTGDCQSA